MSLYELVRGTHPDLRGRCAQQLSQKLMLGMLILAVLFHLYANQGLACPPGSGRIPAGSPAYTAAPTFSGDRVRPDSRNSVIAGKTGPRTPSQAPFTPPLRRGRRSLVELVVGVLRKVQR